MKSERCRIMCISRESWNFVSCICLLYTSVGNMRANYRIASHNTLPMVELLVASIEECGILKEDGRVVLSHMARELHSPEEEYGNMIAAYDGMKLEI